MLPKVITYHASVAVKYNNTIYLIKIDLQDYEDSETVLDIFTGLMGAASITEAIKAYFNGFHMAPDNISISKVKDGDPSLVNVDIFQVGNPQVHGER